MESIYSNIYEKVSKQELENYSKQDLINLVLSMQSIIKSIKSENKLIEDNSETISTRDDIRSGGKRSAKSGRNFDFRKYKLRHIAIKLLYFGWNYSGFVTQEDTQQTIEWALFEALTKTRLIRSRESSNYHRCGRTDKGVSALSQTISIDVRTNQKSGKGVFTPEDYIEDDSEGHSCEKEEINYALILNNVLPENIRVICWTPVMTSFSSRFDCKSRTYKYLFPKADLDIDRMRIGCNYLLGEHDFRNFCKMDVKNGVLNYKRNIIYANIKQYSIENSFNSKQLNDCYSMCSLTITGSAFLWHQIRCIVSLLFLIGQHKEEAEVVKKLLDIENHPSKPQYYMSADFPLVLFDCSYCESDIKEWIYDTKALIQLNKHLQTLWTKHMIKTDVIKLALNSLYELIDQIQSDQSLIVCSHINALYMGINSHVYRPLFERPVCDTLEQRVIKANMRTKTKIINRKVINELKIE